MTLHQESAPAPSQPVVPLSRQRNYQLLFTARLASLIGDGFATVSVAFAVLQMTGSATSLGWVLAARTLPYVVLVLGGGVWADRLSRRKVMIASDVACLTSQGALAALLLTGGGALWHILCLYVVHGTAQAFYKPAQQGIIPDTVDSGVLPRANALLGLGYSIGEIVGPAAAGVVVAASSPGVGFAVDAATFGIGAVLLSQMRLVERRGGTAERGAFRREFAEGWTVVKERTWLNSGIGYFSLFQFLTYGGLFVLGPLVAERHLGGASAWGLMLAGQGVGLALGSLVALRTRPTHLLVAMWLVVALCAAPVFLLLAVPAPLPALVGGFVLYGVAIAYSSIIWSIAMQQGVPREALSRATSYDEMLSSGLRPVGFAVFGPLAAVVGLGLALTCSGLLIAVGGLAMLAIPAVRTLARTDPSDA